GNTRVGRAAGAWRRSLPHSSRSSGGGLGTSNTRDARRFATSMALSVDASGRSCGSGTNVRALVGPRRIISAGRMLSLLLRGFSPFRKLMSGHTNPDEEPTDWRAVCGRTACTVRRAGRARALSDPYQPPIIDRASGISSLFSRARLCHRMGILLVIDRIGGEAYREVQQCAWGEGLSARCRWIEFLDTGRWGCWTDDPLHQ